MDTAVRLTNRLELVGRACGAPSSGTPTSVWSTMSVDMTGTTQLISRFDATLATRRAAALVRYELDVATAHASPPWPTGMPGVTKM